MTTFAGRRRYAQNRGRELGDLPDVSKPLDRGAARHKAARGDQAAREALRRHKAEQADDSITGWSDDGEPIRND